MSQVPLGPDNRFCPLWRKKMSRVCHTCPWWTNLAGEHPRTKQPVDRWQCAISAHTLLQHELVRKTAGVQASVDKVATEVKQSSESLTPRHVIIADNRVGAPLKAIEHYEDRS